MSLKQVQLGLDKLIVRTPGIRGGRPRVAGAGITVRRIAACHQTGMEPEEIVAQYPPLQLAHVHAALAYYYLHRQEIDDDLEREDKEYDRLARKNLSRARAVA